MNFKETLQSVELILAARDVPLLVGDTGIGKTALASDVAKKMTGLCLLLMAIY